MNKKFLTMLLALAMIISMVPMAVAAESECAHTHTRPNPQWDGTHSVYCEDCKTWFINDAACSYEGGSCTVCGAPVPECKHVATSLQYDSNGNGTHIVFCVEALGGCGARLTDTEACDYNESGVCIYCHYQKPAEEPKCDHTYVYTSWTCNNDGTHTAKCQCGEYEETVACTFEPDSDICKFCGYDRSKVEEPEEEVCDCGIGNGEYARPVDATHHNIYCQHDKVVNGPLACTFEDGVCVCGNQKAVETEPEETTTPTTTTTTVVNPNLDVVPKTGSIFLEWLYALIFG